LAERAKSVLGVEFDPEAVRQATSRHLSENLEFRQGAALELDDLPDAAFDLVVCFEVIEPIGGHDGLLSLARRVLAPDGLIVLSTPGREISPEVDEHRDPHHIKELGRPELEQLLARFFAHHGLWGQVATVGSTLRRLDLSEVAAGRGPESGGDPTADEILVRGGIGHWERLQSPPVSTLVAVASQSELVDLPDLSLLNDSGLGAPRKPSSSGGEGAGQHSLARDEESGRHYELWDPERLRRQVMLFEAALAGELQANQAGSAEIADLRGTIEAMNAALKLARAEAAEARADATADANADVASARLAVDRADAELAALRARTDEIIGSRAWRAVTRYRQFRASISGRSRQLGA
jgi:hypothetical protein